MRVREDYRTLSGPEKAAILLLSLPEDQTAKIFEQMDDEEIMELSQTMAGLGKVSPNVVERLFVDFAEQMTSTNSLIGTQDSTERLLAKAGLSGDRIENIMEEIRGPAGRTMWEKLGNVNEEILATF
ncbi:MAG: flagellar motor switch protein FliG, partial [Alphaproteobacteria bacterium]|nr:flagellar motor switch protein FliG [Alphaproteobacteria bacterium]